MKANFRFADLARNSLPGLLIAVLCAAALFFTIVSCNVKDWYEDDIHNKFPCTTVFLVPMDGMSAKQVERLKEDLTTNFADSLWYPYVFEVMNGVSSPDSCLNDAKSRLRANKLINFLEDRYGEAAKHASEKDGVDFPDYYIIGVTDRDISTSIHGKADYGIMGLSYTKDHKASIVSTFRLRNHKDLWKLALHEFAHGYGHAPHCPNDDPHCILRDAKGGNPHFEIKSSLCPQCLESLDISF